MALCLAWPPTLVKIVTGNPVIWAVAAMALGVLYYWPSVLVLIKPTCSHSPFSEQTREVVARPGPYSPSVCLPFGALWVDWIRSLINSQGGGLAYSALEIPMLASANRCLAGANSATCIRTAGIVLGDFHHLGASPAPPLTA